MEDGYEKLAEEVRAAGGRLEVVRARLPQRLGQSIDLNDGNAQSVVERDLAAHGVQAAFSDDGIVLLTSEAAVVASPPLAPTPRPTAPSPSSVPDGLPSATNVGNGLYGFLILLVTFFPAIGHQVAPGGKVGEKQDAFFAIYFATFPLSLAATFIFLMLLFQWFDSDNERLAAAGAAIVVSAIWGIGFGTSYADLSLISQLRGHALAVAIQLVGLALGAYAVLYGWALFVAGWLASLVLALWIKETVDQRQRR
ncbi:MAG: hypothetical protein WD993_04090 [Thermoleophilaceae bacterium]